MDVEDRFVELAMSVGVGDRVAALLADCDHTLHYLAQFEDRRWTWRLEGQRRLLLNPTLKALVALATRLVEQDPSRAAAVAPALTDLAQTHPEFAPYLARVRHPAGAYLDRSAPPASPRGAMT